MDCWQMLAMHQLAAAAEMQLHLAKAKRSSQSKWGPFEATKCRMAAKYSRSAGQ